MKYRNGTAQVNQTRQDCKQGSFSTIDENLLKGLFSLKITDHDEGGSSFFATLKEVQGEFTIEMNGVFMHSDDRRNDSDWNILNGKKNTVETEVDLIFALIGNGCSDEGNDILDALLEPYIEDDFDNWTEHMAQEAANAKFEEEENDAHQKRTMGRF